MDKKKDCKLDKCGNAPDLRGKPLVVGVKQLRKALLAGRAREVYFAENADPALLEPIRELCSQKRIQITWVPGMTELGRACGIEVSAAAAAVVE